MYGLNRTGPLFLGCILGFAFFGMVFAQVQIFTVEKALEGTGIVQTRINAKGVGTVTLRCSYCTGGTLILRVDGETRVEINADTISFNAYRMDAGDFICAFFDPRTRILNRLNVNRG